MLGIALLLHCIYSAYEYNKLSIPYSKTDILLELTVSLGLIFYSAINKIKVPPKLNLNNEIIASPTTYLSNIRINQSQKENDKIGINEYSIYENRVDYIDILKLRHEYSEWAKTIG